VEEGVLHIELLDRPFTGGSNGEHRADGGQLYNRAESLIIVNPGVLCETLEDLASLVPIERSIREELVRDDSLAGDDVGAIGPEKKFSCPISHQGPVLLLHSCAPIWISKGGTDRGQNGERQF
jgi:hypothetical protein